MEDACNGGGALFRMDGNALDGQHKVCDTPFEDDNLEMLLRNFVRNEMANFQKELQQDREKVVRLDALATALRTRVMKTEEHCEVAIRDLEKSSIALQKVLRQQGSCAAESGEEGTTQADQQERWRPEQLRSLLQLEETRRTAEVLALAHRLEKLEQGLFSAFGTEASASLTTNSSASTLAIPATSVAAVDGIAADVLVAAGGEALLDKLRQDVEELQRQINHMCSQKTTNGVNVTELCKRMEECDCAVTEILHELRHQQDTTAQHATQLRRGSELRELQQAEIDQLLGRVANAEERLQASATAAVSATKESSALAVESIIQQRLDALESGFAAITKSSSLACTEASAVTIEPAKTQVAGPVVHIGGVTVAAVDAQSSLQPTQLQDNQQLLQQQHPQQQEQQPTSTRETLLPPLNDGDQEKLKSSLRWSGTFIPSWEAGILAPGDPSGEPSPNTKGVNTPASTAAAAAAAAPAESGAFTPFGAPDTVDIPITPLPLAPQVMLPPHHFTHALGPCVDGRGSACCPASRASPGAVMVGRTIKVGRCSSGAACADTRISSAAWLALRDGIAEVCPGDSSPAVPVPSACGRSRSSGADSRFLRSSSPIQRGLRGVTNSPAGNYVAQQQQQPQQQQVAANLAGSIGVLPSQQGRARRTSCHPLLDGISSTSTWGSHTLQECPSFLDSQAAASVAGPWPPSNSTANQGGPLATLPESARHDQVSRGNSLNRTSIPSLPLQQQQQQQQQQQHQQQQQLTTARHATAPTSCLGGSRQRPGGCSATVTRSPSPMQQVKFPSMDSMTQHGVPQRFPSPRAMVLTLDEMPSPKVPHRLARVTSQTSQNMMPPSMSPRLQRQPMVM